MAVKKCPGSITRMNPPPESFEDCPRQVKCPRPVADPSDERCDPEAETTPSKVQVHRSPGPILAVFISDFPFDQSAWVWSLWRHTRVRFGQLAAFNPREDRYVCLVGVGNLT